MIMGSLSDFSSGSSMSIFLVLEGGNNPSLFV